MLIFAFVYIMYESVTASCGDTISVTMSGRSVVWGCC